MEKAETIGSLLKEAADKLTRAADLTHSSTLKHMVLEARDDVSGLLRTFGSKPRYSDGAEVRNVQDENHDSNQ